VKPSRKGKREIVRCRVTLYAVGHWEPTMRIDAFISYAFEDKPTADAVCSWLERNGIRCWMAPRDLTPGIDYASGIVQAIHAARLMVLVFSEHANRSDQVKREVERAVSHGLAILPLRIADVPPSTALEYYLSTPHWLDALTPPLEQYLDRLAHAVKAVLGQVDDPNGKIGDPPKTTHETGQRKRIGTILAGVCIAIAFTAVAWWALHGGEGKQQPPVSPGPCTSRPDGTASQTSNSQPKDEPSPPTTSALTRNWHDEGDSIRVGNKLWLKDSVYGGWTEAQNLIRQRNNGSTAGAMWRLPAENELEEVRFLFDQGTLSLKDGSYVWTGTQGGGLLAAYAATYRKGQPFQETRVSADGPCHARLVRDAK
jgi:hypothetical protein